MIRVCACIVGLSVIFHAMAISSTLPGFRYVFPLPGSLYASPTTTIIVRPDDPSVLSHLSTHAVSAVGAQSGRHPGKLIFSDDRKTVVFAPATPFLAGEDVAVTLEGSFVGKSGGSTYYNFRISPRWQESHQILSASPAPRHRVGLMPSVVTTTDHKNGNRSLQSSPPPAITVNVNTTPSEGCIFISTFSVADSSSPYLLIVDNSGNLVFAQERGGVCYDFRVQKNGLITYFDSGRGYYVALDNNFVEVDSFMCGNGVTTTDEHELLLLENGHALLLGRVDIPMDMSTVVEGGQPDAILIGNVIQELDQSKNVVFQWNSWDHYAVTDADPDVDLKLKTVDYAHANSVEFDYDGNVFISVRYFNEVTKIDRQTGDIIWRFGGKKNQFTFVNDSIGFSWQHDARRLANGHITVFDNGEDHDPVFSRAVEYELDEVNKVATHVWEYRPQEMYSYYMGSAQRLSNGNTLIGWGGTTGASVTEVTPDGTKVWEMTLPQNTFSYRAYRFPCITPPAPWTLTASATHGRVIRTPDYVAYAQGATVQLTAVAERGYAFAGWHGDIESTANPLLVTMNGNKNVAAEFAPAANTVSVEGGWNLVSVPVVPDDPTTLSCFPNAISSAYIFDGGYVEASALSVGIGYWMKSSGADTSTIAGTLHSTGDISVKPGWNMVGPCEQEIPVSAIISNPAGITRSSFYGYAGGYRDVTTLQPGKGYWIKVLEEGTLRMVGGTAKSAIAGTPSTDHWVVIDCRDRNGRGGTLRLAPSKEIGGSHELPPLPPAGSVDVRFGSGTSVEPAEVYQHVIQFQGMVFPVAIRVTNLDQRALTLRDAMNGSLVNVPLVDGSTVTISQKLETLLLVGEDASPVVPGVCLLAQNFPNPCNPTSDIRYENAESGVVSLKVFDVLGREVAVLVDEVRPPGVYTAHFDGSKLASGVYLYQLRIGKFIDTKKLVLLH